MESWRIRHQLITGVLSTPPTRHIRRSFMLNTTLYHYNYSLSNSRNLTLLPLQQQSMLSIIKKNKRGTLIKFNVEKLKLNLNTLVWKQTTLKLLSMQNHHFVHSHVKCLLSGRQVDCNQQLPVACRIVILTLTQLSKCQVMFHLAMHSNIILRLTLVS